MSPTAQLSCAEDRLIEMQEDRKGQATNSIQLEPPVKMSLARAVEWVATDEHVKVTPNFLPLRKKLLDANARPGRKTGRLSSRRMPHPK